MRRAAGIAALALWPLAAFTRAQFRTSTEIVPIYATVRTADGHLVTDLKSTDFQILDRGDRVPLAVFSNEPQPITLAMLVDMSGGLFFGERYAALHTALLAFVDRLQPQDRARIGTLSGHEIALGYHLTSDHAELHRVINEELWIGGGQRPLWNGVGSAIKSLAMEQGRRIVLVIANGPNTLDLPGFPGVKDVERAATDDGLMVYGVSLFTANQPLFAQPADGTQTRLTLRELTDATGGGYFQAVPGDRAHYFRGGPGDELTSTLANVVEELRHQYALGFVAQHRDGRAGKIEVRVNRPNTTVSARKTYRAPGSGL